MRQLSTRESILSRSAIVQRVRRRFAARDDAGFSLVELIVAIVIITVVLLSGTVAIDFALSASNTQRLKVEATNLAVATMEQDAQLAGSLAIGQTTTTTTINTTTFTVTTNVTELDQNGSQLTTVCTSSGGFISQQIWQVIVSVTWPKMNGAQPVTQSTQVAPGQSNALDLSNGEIAVAVNGTTGLPLTSPINFTITPQYIPDPSSPPPYPTPTGGTNPSGTVFNTGTDGCGVVTGLAASAEWDYVVTLTGNPGWVSSNELSDVNVADPTATLTTSAGQVSRVNPPFQMAQGITTAITLQPVKYDCSGGTPAPSCYASSGGSDYAAPVANLPVTFSNSSLTNGQYTFGNGTSPVTSELLYPYSQYGVWSGDSSESNPGATVTGSSSYLYPGTGSPADTPSPVILSFTGSGSSASVRVPTYDLSIKVAVSCSGDTLNATEQSGSSLSFALNTPDASGVSASGMPLGQYLLSGSGGSSGLCPPLLALGGLYVWITPTGVYQSASATSNPYAGTPVSGSVVVTE